MKIVIASKLALIALLVYFFLDPQVFLSNGFIGVDGAVVCRGLALVFAVKMTYDLVEDIYNEYH